MITLSVGWQRKEMPFVGHTVAQVAETARDAFNIQPDSDVFVNGEKVGPDTVLSEGDNLEFLGSYGAKGCSDSNCTCGGRCQ